MSALDYDYADEIEAELYRDHTLRDVSEDAVRAYLGTYGDAVDKRIKSVLTQAEQLKDAGWCDASITMAVTAIELTIRFLLVRPLMGAAFLSEDWADLLTQRILTRQTSKDRTLLPDILRFHEIDVKQIRLPDDRELWATTVNTYQVRNATVHAGRPATFEQASTAIDCAKHLRNAIVLPLAKKMGFTLETTGVWHRIGFGDDMKKFEPDSPFK